jgi:hypothetical protein
LPKKGVPKKDTLHPGLAALDLIRFAHPAGQPAAVTSLALRFRAPVMKRGDPGAAGAVGLVFASWPSSEQKQITPG